MARYQGITIKSVYLLELSNYLKCCSLFYVEKFNSNFSSYYDENVGIWSVIIFWLFIIMYLYRIQFLYITKKIRNRTDFQLNNLKNEVSISSHT